MEKNLIDIIFSKQKEFDRLLSDEISYDDFSNSEQLIVEVSKALSPNAIKMGAGSNKEAYRILDCVLLKNRRSSIPIKTRQMITSKLIEAGIKTPPIIYNSYLSNVLDPREFTEPIEIQQCAKGSPIFYRKLENLIELANSLENTTQHSNHSNNKLVQQYNLRMLQERVLKGIPFIEDELISHTLLTSGECLDNHGGNILFSELTGYTYIDLSFLNIIDIKENTNIKEYFENKLKNNPCDYNKFFAHLFGSSKFVKNLYYGSFDQLKTEYFSEFIFLGILTQQHLNAMKSSTNPILAQAKNFAEHFNTDFMEDNIFAASPATLDLLHKGITQNHTQSLNSIREKYSLPSNYDFQTMFDCNKFIQAMDLTYAMEKPTNPTLNEDVTEM